MPADSPDSLHAELAELRQRNAELKAEVSALANANAYAAELLAALEEAAEREARLIARAEELDLQNASTWRCRKNGTNRSCWNGSVQDWARLPASAWPGQQPCWRAPKPRSNGARPWPGSLPSGPPRVSARSSWMSPCIGMDVSWGPCGWNCPRPIRAGAPGG
jgi:hypothetical protein